MGFFKKITRPISKVLDKIIPNEIKPALPFVAAALPFLAPGIGAGIGSLFTSNPMLARAIGSGAINLISQASQEGAAQRGISPVSLGIASLTGALASPATAGAQASAADQLRALQTGAPLSLTADTGSLVSNVSPFLQGGELGITQTAAAKEALSTLDTLKNLGLEAAATGSEYLSKGVISPGTPITGDQLLTTAKTLVPGQLAAAGEMAYNAALDANKKYQDQLAAMGQSAAANRQQQIDYIRSAMRTAGFNEDEIVSAIARSGFASGGITRTKFGGGGPGMGSPRSYESFKDFLEQINVSYPELDIINIYDNNPSDAIKILEGMGLISQGKKDMGPTYAAASPVNAAEGGLMNLRMGGMPVEMDFRARGGFVPIGKKERADDVPARLSKNEFVFTAKAVRNAGGGDIRKGAKRMYQIMNQLEARA